MKLESAIEQFATQEAKDEITFRLELQAEGEDAEDGPPDLYLAVSDACDWAEEYGRRAMLSSLRKALIACGVYREVSDDDLKNTMTLGGKNYDFKLDGKKYNFHDHYVSGGDE